MRGSLIIARDEVTLGKKVAQMFMEEANFAVRERERAAIVLTGGLGPRKYLSSITEPYYRDRIPWEQTYIFWTDERCVSPTHRYSNFGHANETLLSKVPLSQDNIYRIPGEMEDPVEAAREYERALKIFFEEEPHWPRFDLVILGVGADGHIASLFPNTAALKDKSHWVMPNFVEKSVVGDLPTNRVTLTLPSINHARKILFVVTGQTKAFIVNEVLRDDFPSGRYPAQSVMPEEGELIWLLDRQAAKKLPGKFLDKATNI
ncbi:MAG: 6-phosphogluconolactonase [Elusimicrobia bacterium]|nr:6-phosphogluconolactonase [Candidatus Obscuribacterium magneticum]